MTTNTSRKTAARPRRPSGTPATAAADAIQAHTTALTLPGVGKVELPSRGSFAYYAAVAGLTALGLIDWPVALLVAAGHLLAQQHGHAVLEEFGEGMEDA